jgi:hypothetical protein
LTDATQIELVTLAAIEAVVEAHADATADIKASDPTDALRMALADSVTTQALMALDPEGLKLALAHVEESFPDEVKTVARSEETEMDEEIRARKLIKVGLHKSKIKDSRAPVCHVTRDFANVVKSLKHENVNTTAKNILKEAAMRKADGRLVNNTVAARTLATHALNQSSVRSKLPSEFADSRLSNVTAQKNVADANSYSTKGILNQPEETTVNRFVDDAETTEGLWSANMKREAAGRLKGTTKASQTVERPSFKPAEINDVKSRLPPEFSNPSVIPNVVGMTLTDLPKPNTRKTKDYVFPDEKNFPHLQKQWNVDLKKPAKPKQQFDPIDGAV